MQNVFAEKNRPSASRPSNSSIQALAETAEIRPESTLVLRASSTPILPYHSARLVFIAVKKRTSTSTNPALRNKARSWRPTQGFGNPAQTLANTSRVVEASDESTIEAPRSGSVTTTRPPGRVTRASSRSADAGSGTNASTRSARVASNVALGKSSDYALPTLICTGRPVPINRL